MFGKILPQSIWVNNIQHYSLFLILIPNAKLNILTWIPANSQSRPGCTESTWISAIKTICCQKIVRRVQTGDVADIFCRRISLKNHVAFFSSLHKRPWSNGRWNEKRLWLSFPFFIYFPGIWKLALPSYEIRCSDAESFISKLALRFPLGTAAELLTLISPSRLCDAQGRHSNSLFFFFFLYFAGQWNRRALASEAPPLFCKAVFDSQFHKNDGLSFFHT